MLTNTTYDNTAGVFQYTSDWFLPGDYTSSTGVTGTLASAYSQTASVAFVFPAPALAFYYYGIKRCCGGMYRISVDGTPFIQIDAVGSAHGESGDNSPEVLFSQQFDTPGIHSVVLENIADVRYPNGNSQITLDRFVLAVQDDSTQLPVTDTPLPPSSPSTTEISTSGGSEPTKTTSIQLTDGPTPSFTSSAMQSLESRPSESRASSATQSTMTHNNPPGSSPLSKPSIMSSPTKNLPVGLSVGLGLLVATIAASIVWLLRRRCKRRQKLQTRQPDAFMLKYDSSTAESGTSFNISSEMHRLHRVDDSPPPEYAYLSPFRFMRGKTARPPMA